MMPRNVGAGEKLRTPSGLAPGGVVHAVSVLHAGEMTTWRARPRAKQKRDPLFKIPEDSKQVHWSHAHWAGPTPQIFLIQ